jgi:hypothetical protein
VPQHPHAVQFRAARDRGRGARPALQFVRKLSGFNAPSQANAAAFERAVEEVSDAARRLLVSLHATRPPRDRVEEAEKARARSRERFA